MPFEQSLDFSLQDSEHPSDKRIEIRHLRVTNSEGGDVELVAYTHRQKLPRDLPYGYCYMGGVARTVILREMGDVAMDARDEDVVAIQEFHPNVDKDFVDNLGKEIMPEDFEYGHGINIEGLADYFSKRDFTINQILVHGKVVIATPQALEDLKSKTVRPTKFEQKKWNNYEFDSQGTHPKLVMKSVRLAQEFIEMYGDGKIEGIEKWEFDSEGIPLFYIALHLDKAFERGDKIAERFFIGLLNAGTIRFRDKNSRPFGLDSNNPRELAHRIRACMFRKGKDPFLFSKDDLNELVELSGDETVVGNEDYDRGIRLAKDYLYSKNTKKLGIKDYI